jgi:hypothetical protein
MVNSIYPGYESSPAESVSSLSSQEADNEPNHELNRDLIVPVSSASAGNKLSEPVKPQEKVNNEQFRGAS